MRAQELVCILLVGGVQGFAPLQAPLSARPRLQGPHKPEKNQQHLTARHIGTSLSTRTAQLSAAKIGPGNEGEMRSPAELMASSLAFLDPSSVWSAAPWIAGVGFIGWRGVKAYNKFIVRQGELVDEFGRSVSAATMKSNRRPYYDTLYSIYRRKLVYRRKEDMLCTALMYVCRQPVSTHRIEALQEFLQACRVSDPALIFDKAGLEVITKTNERGKLLFYARRLGVGATGLEDLILKGLRNNPESLKLTQKILAENAYKTTIKNQKAAVGDFAFDASAAEVLGVDPEAAQSIVDELNAPDKEDAVEKEDWLEELEAKVTEESGPVEMASDNPDAFPPENLDEARESEKMVRAECQECGYTLFIAKGREWKFFGDSYTCANCGAPRSKFTIEDMNEDADTTDDSSTSFLVDDPVDEPPKVEDKPKVEEPKVEEPVAEEPKVEEPVAEEPKVEEPKVEEPVAEEPKVEEPPVVEEPKAEEPVVVEEPKAEEPKVEEVKAEEPKPEEPKPEEPKVEEVKAEEPQPEEPKAEEPPKPEEPKAEEPKPEEPKAEEPKVEEPKAEEPKAEEPKPEEPKVEEVKAEEPKVEEVKAEEPKPEEPKAEEPKPEEPKAEEPVVEKKEEKKPEPFSLY